ncbi:MAG TPA: hypothetical protein VEX68_23580 [Bryobacteraceae bacterium]|nr:hypothetical protein [Bryobacteraceae bacterium]
MTSVLFIWDTRCFRRRGQNRNTETIFLPKGPASLITSYRTLLYSGSSVEWYADNRDRAIREKRIVITRGSFPSIKQEHGADRHGQFIDPDLAAIVRAIAEMRRMRVLLAKQSDLDDCGEAGKTLLAYTVRQVLGKRNLVLSWFERTWMPRRPESTLMTDVGRIIFRVVESNGRCPTIYSSCCLPSAPFHMA